MLRLLLQSLGVNTLNGRREIVEAANVLGAVLRAVLNGGAPDRLLATYEPGADYEPIVDGDFYGPRLRQLAAIRLKVLATDAKFKVGPAAPVEVKQRVVAGLRARNEPGDARAADVIEATLPRGE